MWRWLEHVVIKILYWEYLRSRLIRKLGHWVWAGFRKLSSLIFPRGTRIKKWWETVTGHLATREFRHQPTRHQETISPPTTSPPIKVYSPPNTNKMSRWIGSSNKGFLLVCTQITMSTCCRWSDIISDPLSRKLEFESTVRESKFV